MPFQSTSRHVIAGVVVGTMFESYDFVVYGYMLIYTARAFFPTGDSLTALLSTTIVFGAGFVMRPLGAVLLGGYADRAGRRAGLSLTLVLMAVGIAVIGITPSYETIGLAAPIVVVAGRLLQGFSAGGEFGGATALLLEQALPGFRGRIGSLQQVATGLSLLMGAGGVAAASGLLSKTQMEVWGWRIPFLFGLLILPIGLYLRSSVPQTDNASSGAPRHPVADVILHHHTALIRGAGLMATATACGYVLLVYMPTYVVRELSVKPTSALLINGAGVAGFTLSAWVVGAWSDRIGRRLPMLVSMLTLLALVAAVFAMIGKQSGLPVLLTLQVVLGALTGSYNGPCITLVGELFPKQVRSSGVSLAYTAAVVTFGGFAPFLVTWLIAITGSKLAPAYYVMGALTIGLIALASTRNSELHDDDPTSLVRVFKRGMI